MQRSRLSLGGNQLLGCLIIFISICFKTYSQVKVTVPDIEKTYLHTDRNYYNIGESLWYKVYSVYAYNNLLFNNSNVLYVELISPDSKIIARNKINIEQGLGHGDFKLTDSTGVKKAGIYQLRAYTNWNRNFDNDFVFKKEIEIMDAFKAHSDNLKKPTKSILNENSSIEERNTIKIDFFPEGGSLLQNVANLVAFKAVDVNGKPIKVTGEVFDNEDNLVSLFLSTHDGMGKFQFIPISGKQYYAKIKTVNGQELKQELPKADTEGYLLSCKTVKGRTFVVIKTNQETFIKKTNEELTVNFKTRGISYLKINPVLTKLILSFELPKADIPEGICQITLYDSSSKPQSERLVYIEKEHDLNVKVTTDKITYKPNEKVVLNISSKSKAGDVKSASYSLSVTDLNGVTDEKTLNTNISSYFLMESDIRGKVHNPGYYFNSNNPKRLEHLDALLLTQGWRNFLWKTTRKLKDSIPFKVENGINITGRVEQLFGEKPKPNMNVSLALMNKTGMNVFSDITDSLGNFKFEKLMLSGKTNMFLNSRNEKGKNKGEIVLNPIGQKPIPVYFKDLTGSFIETTNKNSIVEHVYRKHINFGVAPENILDEVEIIGKKKKQTISLHGIPDLSYVVDENTPVVNDVLELVQLTISGVIIERGDVNGDYLRFMRYDKDKPALILINDFPIYDISELDFIQPDNVEKIEAIRGATAAIYGTEGANGVIAIYTKKLSGNQASKEDFHTIKKEIEGFYEARVFYTPDLNKPSTDMYNKEAIRNTIYWNPYVHPDANGNVSTTYYNSSVETKVKVTLEGITATGIPVVKHMYYTIEE
ncbi:TonB-dependent receptor [Thalassobellus sediminis]|uniref:TonB-dependent receptor n=1 Tax=Thalassobellus sediminis TaxID=3367753 RepID=UPI0037971546